MRSQRLLLLSAILLLASCGTFREPLPVSAFCPAPPPAPLVVTTYASPQMNLIEESTTLLRELQSDLIESLKKANDLQIRQ